MPASVRLWRVLTPGRSIRLRAYMLSIYNFMAIGVAAVTGIVALVVYNMAVTTVGAP